MTQRIKIFLIVFVLLFCLIWGGNLLSQNLKEFFFWQQLAQNEKLLAAQNRQAEFEQRIRELKPLRDNNVPDLTINAKSAFSILLNNQDQERILFEKNIDQKLPIASLTKLMTTNVILKHYDLQKEIRISKEAIQEEENFGQLNVGIVLTVEELLYPLLMESSNDAAFSLANDYDGTNESLFVEWMNEEAQELNLSNTHFVNVTGLDPDEGEPQDQINYSTSRDLVKLAEDLLDHPLIWEILATDKINLYGPELVNTNKLLNEIPRIVGGKTGFTDEALGCFLLVLEAPKSKGYLINAVLGSTDRFGEMEKLINWLQQAYQW